MKLVEVESLEELIEVLAHAVKPDLTLEQIAEAEAKLGTCHTLLYSTWQKAIDEGKPSALLHIGIDGIGEPGLKGAVMALTLDTISDFIKRSYEEYGKEEFHRRMRISMDTVVHRSHEAFKEAYDSRPEQST